MARVLTLTLNPALDLSVETPPIRLGQVNRTERTQLDAAGKGINLARVLRRLGHEVMVSGLLGLDNAAPFEQLFADEGLEDHFLRVPGTSRTNVKLAETGGRITDLNGTGFDTPADALNRLQFRLSPLLGGCDAVVIAGSLPVGFAPSALAELIRRCAEADRPAWLDTSGAALTAGIGAHPTGVKPNAEELAEWAGRPLPDLTAQADAGRQLQQSGIAHVVISRGADGVLWLNPRRDLLARAPQVPVVSTVCAGDTLLAGLLHGELSGLGDHATLQLATALSAECVRHVGVGNPDADDFQQLQQHTRVTPWPDTTLSGEASS
ncbi:1-phosphofructokinase [Marinobacter halodurans]|uniref:Phosphofructokinase n=1 Tax=Marinobacter halodurans TaxID=2528979 RepID=A0ABY1ZID0_9GAMM|nr:1-phosphofructokinase [Marinobacter halodurans]TBW49823.1 1-phosphofructokinase [Marinobacter halodurans]